MRHVVNGKVPQHAPFHFLLNLSKILVFSSIILKCDIEPSTKPLQDAMIQACAGVEVIPQGPPEGDHMANGRVDNGCTRSETTMQDTPGFPLNITQACASLTTVRYSSWLSRFAAQVMDRMRIGKEGKTRETRRIGRRWRKPTVQFEEKVWFRKIGEDGVSSSASRVPRGIFVSVIMIEREQFCALPGIGVVRG